MCKTKHKPDKKAKKMNFTIFFELYISGGVNPRTTIFDRLQPLLVLC